ncbi:MAG: tyrosine-type recombinase/integrase [Hyphomicrobiaceae bacterium]
MPKLIEGYADKLAVPAGSRDTQVFDDDLPGFGIRKFDSGRASYFVKFNVGRQQRRKTLGAVVRGNLKAMRLEASKVLAKARLGTDVVQEAKAAAARSPALLGDLVPKYLAALRMEVRPKSHAEARRYLEQYWRPLHGRSIEAVTRQDVVGIIDGLEHKIAADRARIALSGLFGWAIDRGYCDANPTMHIRARGQHGSRTRVLTEDELIAVWRACGNEEYGAIVRLLILTGQRRSEIGDLMWSEIDLAKRQFELPGHRTKNGRPHLVPLSDAAFAILETIPRREGRELVFGLGAGGFGGWSKSKADLDRRIAAAAKNTNAMPVWTLHDLRRTFVTHVSEHGIAAPHVVESIVNHVSGAKAGVAGVYNRATYLPEKRRALDLWGAHVTALVERREGNVVLLQSQQLIVREEVRRMQ